MSDTTSISIVEFKEKLQQKNTVLFSFPIERYPLRQVWVSVNKNDLLKDVQILGKSKAVEIEEVGEVIFVLSFIPL